MDIDPNLAVDTVGKGIDFLHMLLKPWATRKMADAKMYEAEVMLEIEARKNKNLYSVMQKTTEYIEEAWDNLKIDEDWFMKFIEFSQNTNNEELQDLLAKILAEKLKHPEACSLRTLSVLNNLSYDECILFGKLIRFSIKQKNGNVYIPHPEVINNYKPGTTMYSEHLLLSECGLTNVLDGCYRINPDNEVCLIYGGYVGVVDAQSKQIDSWCMSILTVAGKEIYHILKKYIVPEYDLDFFRCALRFIGERNGMSVSLHKLIKYDVTDIEYYRDNVL